MRCPQVVSFLLSLSSNCVALDCVVLAPLTKRTLPETASELKLVSYSCQIHMLIPPSRPAVILSDGLCAIKKAYLKIKKPNDEDSLVTRSEYSATRAGTQTVSLGNFEMSLALFLFVLLGQTQVA